MKTRYSVFKIFSFGFLFLSITSFAQNRESLWVKTSKEESQKKEQVFRKTQPKKALFYQLDIDELKSTLQNAPERKTANGNSNVVISFPMADGTFESFKILEASVMDPKLQEKHPNMRSYVGQSLSNPATTIRFSVTPKGLHTMLFSSEKGMQFIDPYTKHSNEYIVYAKSDLPKLDQYWECGVIDEIKEDKSLDFDLEAARNANDGMLREYRLALACTIEYAQFHWEAAGLTVLDTEADRKDAVHDAMVVTMTRNNGVYERDLSLTMQLIANNRDIIFILSDNFSNSSASALIDESQTEIDAIIGSANYDIGHTFSTGGGGLAQLNSPCTVNKARGITGLSTPVGDPYDIDFVAHEMGHQFGAPHTFNGSSGNCAGANRTASNAYEPGSGSTIMAYAGICAPQNIQLNSDAYFHQKSLQMIWDNISTGLSSTCPTETATGNSAPTSNAGSDYSIPISTPYKLTGSSTDGDGTGTHTYTWEQYDLGPADPVGQTPSESVTTGPIVRTFEGTSSPTRFIPRFSDVVANGGVSTTWEKLSSADRVLTFRLTVRDNDVSGGQTAVDEMVINTISAGGPFTVSNPPTWGQGTTQTVSWNVGESANPATINCQNVNIKFSTDGGATYPTTLVSSTPNDGTQSITVPSLPDTNNARIMVEAVDNIFYNVSSVFSVNSTPDYSVTHTNGNQSACNIDSVTYNFDYLTSNGFSETTVFSASGNPAGSTVTFTPGSLNTDGSFTMVVSNLTGATPANYTITVTATASIVKTVDVDLSVTDSVCSSLGTEDYETSTTLVQFGDINNVSAKPLGYSDYTAMVTDVNIDSSYDLTVNANTDGNFTTNTRVWIDWNQNCSFEDAGEEYDLGDASNVANGATANSPLSITTPSGAVLGNTVMRVTTKYLGEGLSTSCENGHDAEVEDYTINVLMSLSVNEKELSNFVIYPNPNKGNFTIKFNSPMSNDVSVEVFDIRGRKLLENLFNSSGNFNETINLGNIQSGLYLVNVSDGERRSTRKIIIE